ncbi:MAG TPA: outer membrane protein assembly factor BamD [Planctomycetota bacterium]|nr:outer membrane protein assembly factor BamD [Planctomycetota bacterium]
MVRTRVAVLLAAVVFLPACRSLSRDINQSLPGFLRSEAGEEELERLAVMRRARTEATPEEKAAWKARVDEAKAWYAAGDWEEAGDLFESFLEDHPGTEFDEECRFLFAESRYREDELAEAFSAYKSYALNYPISPRNPTVEERLYDAGREYIEGRRSTLFGIFTNTSKGVEILTYLVETFPNAERADDAEWLIARYHLDDEEWDKAAASFDLLVTQYKTSEWTPAARWFSAYCRYRRVKGDVYDPEVIEQARQRFADYVRDYPAGEWRPEAERILAILDATAAERMYNVAEWYRDQDKDYSARYYYLKLIKSWPQSEAAARARARYAEVAGAEPTEGDAEALERERREAAAEAPASRPETAPAGR